MEEVGLFQEEPTLIYQDNKPAIAVAENEGHISNKSPQNAPSTREVYVFLTDPPPKSVKISGLKNFHICTGGVFLNIILAFCLHVQSSMPKE